ncbi:disease resistance protein RPV1-like [Ziziphus jujuba]|uniref:Disease resistance protein RPV1-like n=1 Tax=Ziziphus jujuba TaxID=326968 RepID=A0ABM4AB31_ZIZJJ|nr:disease resistance protein RPV1-like [Ziziphus jujuba]
MGGMGKTTLAKVVFQKLSNSQSFDCCCFLEDVRKIHKGPNGLDHPTIFQRLRCVKALIVSDDVDRSIQLEAFINGCCVLAPGSRIIVTTRDEQVLKTATDSIHKVERLNDIESLELFRLCAFRENSPTIDYEMVLEATTYAYGNPLALKVLGSSLCRRPKDEWESVLKKLKKNQNLEIKECLIEDDEGNELQMHDLLCQMGQEIVCDEVKEPGKRSRLCDVVEGTAAVEVISLDMFEIEKNVIVHPGAFSNMRNLRLLRVYYGRSEVLPLIVSPNLSLLLPLKLFSASLATIAAITSFTSKPYSHCFKLMWFGSDLAMYLSSKTLQTSVAVVSFDTSLNTLSPRPRIIELYAFFNNSLLFLTSIVSSKCSSPSKATSNPSFNNTAFIFIFQRPKVFELVNFSTSNLVDMVKFAWVHYNQPSFSQWESYPSKSLPSQFNPENLVGLLLRGSHVEKLWNTHKYLPVLRRMDLSFSKFLTQVPNLTWAPNLEKINPKGCISLVIMPIPPPKVIGTGLIWLWDSISTMLLVTALVCTLVDAVRGVTVVLDTAQGASTMIDMTKGATGMDAALKADIPIGVDKT